MPWYKSGTVSVTQNSNAVIGAGTAFIANSRVGDAFRGPDGSWYEVTNIASNTALSISPSYQGSSNSAGVYALAPMQGYVKDSADALRALVNQFGSKLASLGTTGNYDILPVEKGGTGAENASAARGNLGAAKSGPNSDITELNALTKPIIASQGGLAPGFIEGLYLTWVSATSISLGTGAAYSPNTGRILQVLTPITISGLSLAANS